MWLRRHDEQNSLRSVERYSSALRVLSRRAEGGRSSYVVRRGDERPVIAPESKRSAATLRARRVAAMRRRRVLSILTLSLLSVGALAAFAILPVWTPAIPGLLVVAFLVAARMSVRRQRDLLVRRTAGPAREATRVEASHAYGPAVSAEPEPADAESTVEVAVETPAAAPEDPAAEGLWDPVPVTLPIYVYKEKAPPRTVRTISLPGTDFTVQVHGAEEGVPEPVAEASAPAAPPVVEPEEELAEHIQIARAVGD
jgi:hypothetical protein